MSEFDWNDLRAFLAVVRTRRPVTAAHQLRMDQSTLSRRIFGLEKALQTRLFDRMPTGYALTISGETLVSQAEEMSASQSTSVRGSRTHIPRWPGRFGSRVRKVSEPISWPLF